MRDRLVRLALAACVALLSGCSHAPETPGDKRVSGFYTDDAPLGALPVNLDSLAEPVPRPELLDAKANEPYDVFGKQYIPYREPVQYRKQGVISWYGRKFQGRRTWSGEIFDMYALTAAHPTLPIPSYARVTNLENGRSVVVRINDRGPFHAGRIMDVSYAAAYKLGFANVGSVMAEVEALLPGKTAQTAKSAGPDAADVQPVVHASVQPHGVYLQLGAFQSKTNAESFRDKLQPQLTELRLAADAPLREKLYRVQVGPFNSRDEARSAAARLREILGIQPVLVVR